MDPAGSALGSRFRNSALIVTIILLLLLFIEITFKGVVTKYTLCKFLRLYVYGTRRGGATQLAKTAAEVGSRGGAMFTGVWG